MKDLKEQIFDIKSDIEEKYEVKKGTVKVVTKRG
jgi:hypothetical protein